MYTSRFENKSKLYCGQLSTSGSNINGNLIAPLITTSNIVCSNLHAEIWSGKYINESVSVGDILVCSNAQTQTFTRLPVGANGTVLTSNSSATLGINWV